MRSGRYSIDRRIAVWSARARRRIPGRSAPGRHIRDEYLLHFARDPRRERLFLSSVSFLLTFAGVRGLTHGIRSGKLPFGNLSEGGTHIHHLVWGILGLLGTGYIWNAQLANGQAPTTHAGSVASSLAYGSASALTLDEFALWLNLQDDYWNKQGRESIDAVVIFGALLSAGAWGGPFMRSAGQRIRRSL